MEMNGTKQKSRKKSNWQKWTCLVLDWDPDFTKVAQAEAATIKQAEEEITRGEYIRHEDINWD